MSWPIGAPAEQYVIGSTPSLSKQVSETVFPGLADLITAAVGEGFAYRYTGNWPSYIKSMREAKFDLVFEEPHLVSWRVEHLRHIPLVKLNGTLRFVIITRDNDDTVIQLRDLAGRTVCADAPPAIDGLVLFGQFQNPSRQPALRRVRDPATAYARLLQGRCRGAVLPSRLYERLDREDSETRILFLSEPLPNWAVSADRRLPQGIRERIRQVLLDPGNTAVTGLLTDTTGEAFALLPAGESDYRGYTDLLRDFWGLQ